MKTHTGIKEFKCETCGKEFMIERNLVSIKLNFLRASLHSYLFPPSPPLLTLHEISLYLTLVTQNILLIFGLQTLSRYLYLIHFAGVTLQTSSWRKRFHLLNLP